MWATANKVSYSRLVYKPTTVDGIAVPPPQRQPMTDVPQGVLAMAMHARDTVKATMGLFDSSMGAAGTANSGKQELAQQRQGQVTNFHFADNLARAIRQGGRCLLSMVPRIYDTPRMVRILGEDETPGHEWINRPLADGRVHDLRVGKYDLVVSTGPAYQTMRQEAAEGMRDMVGVAKREGAQLRSKLDKSVARLDLAEIDQIQLFRSGAGASRRQCLGLAAVVHGALSPSHRADQFAAVHAGCQPCRAPGLGTCAFSTGRPVPDGPCLAVARP